MKNITLKNGDEVEIDKIPNDKFGNERYLIKSANGEFEKFIYLPKGVGAESDPLNTEQAFVLSEIKNLIL